MKHLSQLSPAVLQSGTTLRGGTHTQLSVSTESCNLFIFVRSGHGIHEVGGCRRVLSPHTIEIIPPYQHQIIENRSAELLDLVYIYFDLFETETPVSHKAKNRPASVDEMFFADQCCYKVAQKNPERVAELCEQILLAGTPDSLPERLRQKQRMLELLILFLEEDELTESGTVHPQTDYVFRAMQYIEMHYGDASLCAKSTAQTFGLSTDYLSRLFQKHARITLSNYIRTLRIARAKELLLFDPSVASVAAKCGFSSVQSFCRTFRQLEQHSPSAHETFLIPPKEKNES